MTRMRQSEMVKKLKRGRSSNEEEEEKKIEDLKNLVEKLNLDMEEGKKEIANTNVALKGEEPNIIDLKQEIVRLKEDKEKNNLARDNLN